MGGVKFPPLLGFGPPFEGVSHVAPEFPPLYLEPEMGLREIIFYGVCQLTTIYIDEILNGPFLQG